MSLAVTRHNSDGIDGNVATAKPVLLVRLLSVRADVSRERGGREEVKAGHARERPLAQCLSGPSDSVGSIREVVRPDRPESRKRDRFGASDGT